MVRLGFVPHSANKSWAFERRLSLVFETIAFFRKGLCESEKELSERSSSLHSLRYVSAPPALVTAVREEA